MSISIVIPAYNGESSLETVVRQTLSVLGEISPDYEIILVNDGSTDDTGAIADGLAAEDEHIYVIHHPHNLGLGAALRTGFSQVRHDLVSSLPADGQIAPVDMKRFAKAIEGVDVVTGYFTRREDAFHRTILTKGLRLFMHLLFGKLPRLQGARMFRRELLNEIELHSTTGLMNLELIVKASRKGYRFREIPIAALPRMSGESKVTNAKTILKTMFEMFKLRWSL
ncbi:MAG: glycosyltransferase family 2 protein [Anaerolineae bacterium]|nr:MAG: glycosyltransferase family 2 protein [Anaerolineae bacterium]